MKEIEGGTLVARNAVFADYLHCGVETEDALQTVILQGELWVDKTPMGA